MKIPSLIVLLFLGFLPSVLAGSIDQLFRDARADFNRGDYMVAKAKFTEILSSNPNHTGSKSYLVRIDNLMKASASLKNRISKIILPGVSFNEATLGSVLEYLTQASNEVTGGETTVNFVAQLPKEELQAKTVTLNLNNPLPMSEVMRYIGQLADVDFRVEQYAVSVVPRGSGAAESVETGSTPLENSNPRD